MSLTSNPESETTICLTCNLELTERLLFLCSSLAWRLSGQGLLEDVRYVPIIWVAI